MRATLPIIMCDAEDGCDEFMTAYFEMGVSNWRELVPAGWKYDAWQDRDAALCPEHTAPKPTDCGTTAPSADAPAHPFIEQQTEGRIR